MTFSSVLQRLLFHLIVRVLITSAAGGTAGGRVAAVGRNTAASVVDPVEDIHTVRRGCTPVALEAARSFRLGTRGRASRHHMQGTVRVVGWSLKQTE